ncbi:FAD binding domain-containing protein [Bacillus mojavensis]|uniref:FAD binding domain-containing protein n=1 Tax=Bacillus mojavensis TaxID=72360 RepID=UPI002DB8C015|nr:FAD binding domain-containing protein [Bacillus mojavensis]MEC1686925.1 FAD binding domain-containing protein [Bacillus mojavensis]
MNSRYFYAQSIEEAVYLLKHEPNAHILGGGQTLINQVSKMEIGSPFTLIDISRIKECQTMSLLTDHNRLEIGAAVKLAEIIQYMYKNQTMQTNQLEKMLRSMGDTQIRNAASFCGTIANSDPLSDIWPVLLIAGGTGYLTSNGKNRFLHFNNWFNNTCEKSLHKTEFLVKVEVNMATDYVYDKFYFSESERVTVCTRMRGSRHSTVAVGGIDKYRPLLTNLKGDIEQQQKMLFYYLNVMVPGLPKYKSHVVVHMMTEQIKELEKGGDQYEPRAFQK